MIKKIALGIILNGLALYGVMYLMPDIQYTGGFAFFALGGFVMGMLNFTVRPLIDIITFPLRVITLGLFIIVINGVMFWLFHQVIDALAIGDITMVVPDLKTYFLSGVLFGIINWVIHLVIHNK